MAAATALGSTSSYATRSNLITLRGVTNVYYGGFTAVNPSQHTLVNLHSDNVTVNGVRLLTEGVNNADGIEFTHGNGLTVINNVFDTGDDDMNFAAGLGAAAPNDPPTRNAWIADNYFRRGHGAVVLGSHTGAWIEGIEAEDNVIDGTDVGLRMKTDPNNGGGGRDVLFRDNAIRSVTAQAFIFISVYSDPNAAGGAVTLVPGGLGTTWARVSWAPATDAYGIDHYTVEVDGRPVSVAAGTAGTLTVTRLRPGTRYTVTVAAVDDTGNSTGYPAALSVTTNPPYDVGVPTWRPGDRLSVRRTGPTGVTVTWPAARDARGIAGYRVYVDGRPVPSGTPFTPIDTASTVTGTSASLTGLAPGARHTIVVQAGDTAGRWTGTGLRVTLPPGR